MSAQHTPGPWELHKPAFGEQHIYVNSCHTVHGMKVKSGRQHICVVPYEGKRGAIAYHEMFNANARLIAAAPDMLAALIVAREFISTDRTALADCSMDPEGRMSEDDAAAVADYDKALLQIDAAIQKATGGAA